MERKQLDWAQAHRKQLQCASGNVSKLSSLEHCDGCFGSPLDHLHSHGTCASKARSKVCRSSLSIGAETAGRSTRAHGEATAAPMAAPTHGYRLNQQSAGKSIPLTPELMGPETGKVRSTTDLFSATILDLSPLHFSPWNPHVPPMMRPHPHHNFQRSKGQTHHKKVKGCSVLGHQPLKKPVLFQKVFSMLWVIAYGIPNV